MADLRTEIREAFALEQSSFPLAPTLRREVVYAVVARPNVGSHDGGRQLNHQWLAVAAAILITVAIVAGLMTVRLMSLHPTVVKPGPAPQLCVPGTTPPADKFARVHGCITYVDGTGSEIVAVDPYHPANRISLGPSNGGLPIAWSRDGSRLLLMSCATWCDLDVMNADGSEVRLTLGDVSGWEGSFSPDGTKVIYDRYQQKVVPGGIESTNGLYVVDVQGGAPRLIANSNFCSVLSDNQNTPIQQGPCDKSSTESMMTFPIWSPNGSRIAYADYRYDLATDQIWTMNPDGTGQRRLVDLGNCGATYQSAGCTNGLEWSPDGSQLAFNSAGGIYTVHADGSGLRRIRKDGVQPHWSPDGSRIAFTIGGELFTMAPDGSSVTQVVGLVVQPPFGWVWNPVNRP